MSDKQKRAERTVIEIRNMGEDLALLESCAFEAYKQMRVNKAFTQEQDARFVRALASVRSMIEHQAALYENAFLAEAAGSLRHQMGKIMADAKEAVKNEGVHEQSRMDAGADDAGRGNA